MELQRFLNITIVLLVGVLIYELATTDISSINSCQQENGVILDGSTVSNGYGKHTGQILYVCDNNHKQKVVVSERTYSKWQLGEISKIENY